MQNEEGKINLLTIGEASEYLGISIDTLRRWERRGRIEPLRSPGGHRYYNKTDLDNLFGKKYARDEETHRPSGPYKDEVSTDNNNSESTAPAIINDPTPTRTVIGIPSWRAVDLDENIESYNSTPLATNIPEILDRPVREVKIPENSRIRVTRTEEFVSPQEAYYRQQSVSVLTPSTATNQDNGINNLYNPINSPIVTENRQVASVNSPILEPVQSKPQQNIEESMLKGASGNKKMLVYIGITVGVIFLLITWYLLWVSSQKILSQLP